MNTIIITVAFIVTGLLFVLNIAFAYVFRKRRPLEVSSYLVAALVELFVFSLALIYSLNLFRIPYHLPPGLPVNRAEIGATLAVGLGLFPAAYWHRTSASTIRAKMAEDARVLKQEDGGVRIRSNGPGEWMN